mgnify:CR=1 FL=1
MTNKATTRAVIPMLVMALNVLTAPQAKSEESAVTEEIVVYGSRSALLNALEKQRASDKIVGVVDSDDMGNFADTNVAESLRRIASVMVENDQGEGRYVSVRGMNADLNAMTINGVSTASPEDRRGIMLDGVPTDILDSMVVYKTLTPNLDADTIGGAIDLVTITAFKHKDMFAKIKIENSYNELAKDSSNPKLGFTYTNRFPIVEGELGVAVSLSDQSRRIVAQNNEMGGWSDTAPNNDYEMRFYDIERERQGAVVNIDYLGVEGNRYYLHLFHNEYTDVEYRAKWETRAALQETPLTSGSTFIYPFSRMDTEARQREEIRKIQSFQVGTEFQLNGETQVAVELFGSQAEQDDTDKWNVIFRSSELATPLTFDNSNPKKPILGYASDFYDAGTFKLKALEGESGIAKDKDRGFRVDITTALNAATEIQYGAKYRARTKANDYNFCGYDPLESSTLADYSFTIIDPYLGNAHGPAPTVATVGNFVDVIGAGTVALSDGTTCRAPGPLFELSGDEEAESIAADWYTDEDVLAVYAMATTELEQMVIVYGLRYEDTSTVYRGKQFDGSAYAGAVSYENDYSFLAPSVNLKYYVDDDRVVRAGVFRSLVRPGFGQSSAGAELNLDDNEIKGGNPGLRPTKAWNMDVSYDWYINDETFFTAGLFYKRISDAIVEVNLLDSPLRGVTWDRAETFVNTGATQLWGFEMSYQVNLSNGLLLVANLTHTDGETDLPADSAFGSRTIPYFKQAANTANLMVGYEKDKLDVRLAANYRDKYLDAIGANALADRYTSDYIQIDLTGKYRVNDKLVLKAAAMNLNDRPEFYYFGNAQRLSQYDEFGTSYEIGMSYEL